MAKYMTNEEIDSLKRELELLGDGEPYVKPPITLTVAETKELLLQLQEVVPFLVKYVSIANKAKKYIPINGEQAVQLREYLRIANELEGTELAFLYANCFVIDLINTILNGFSVEDAEDKVQIMFIEVKAINSFLKTDIDECSYFIANDIDGRRHYNKGTLRK